MGVNASSPTTDVPPQARSSTAPASSTQLTEPQQRSGPSTATHTPQHHSILTPTTSPAAGAGAVASAGVRALPTLRVSRVVWELVVVAPTAGAGLGVQSLFRLAEAMFPLLALVCRRVMAHSGDGSYRLLAVAAGSRCPACVAWIAPGAGCHQGGECCADWARVEKLLGGGTNVAWRRWDNERGHVAGIVGWPVRGGVE
ncbi:hypothetical protein Pelo_18788 [Pelomyxa schiedti]|nr:hypothetical protein Pelo_18788 [Pelomyxa schiedti]